MKRCLIGILLMGIITTIFPLIGCKSTPKVRTMYEITAEFVPESRTLAGAVKVTFENDTDSEISLLKFNLYPNAYRQEALIKPVSHAYRTQAYYEGESYGETVVSSVNGAKSWEIAGEDDTILYAHLERPLLHGDKVVLDIGFMTKLAKVNHRTGIAKNSVNLGNFFPALCGLKNGGFYECAYYPYGEPFYSDIADYRLTLTLPREYLVAASGVLENERRLESKTAYTFIAARVRDFAVTAAKGYDEITATVGNTELAYYFYDDKAPEESLQVAVDAFSYYTERFGAYPYPRLTLAQTGLCVESASYPALIMLSDGLSGMSKTHAIARSVAKEWWGCAVGSDNLENGWQSDGLSEYSACLFFEAYEKYGVSRESLVRDALKEYRSYYDVYGSVLGRTDTAMIRHLKDFVSDYEYRTLATDKAVVMFDTLQKSVGDKKFFSACKKYYARNGLKNATPAELIGCFEKSGVDVKGFFDSFLLGKAIL